MVHSGKWKVLCAALAVGIGGQSAFASEPATQPSAVSQQALLDKVNTLQQEVTELKAQQKQNQEDVSAAIQHVLTESDQHSQMLDGSSGGFMSGFSGNRFVIQSDDGNFVLRPWIHIQVRQTTSYRRDELGKGQDDVENGFELRRARLGFDGNLFTPDFTYFINWATFRENGTLTTKNSAGQTVGTSPSPVGGLPVLEEAWVKNHFANTPYYIKFGQLHDPLDHEAIIGSKYRAPEASLTGDIFANTDTFTQGATFIYDPKETFRFEGGFTDGIRSANTNFEDAPNNGIEYRWGRSRPRRIEADGQLEGL